MQKINNMPSSFSFVFFGTGPLAESVLASLMRAGYTPSLIVTKPDSHAGRLHTLTTPYIKVWAELKNIPVYQPITLKDLPRDNPLFTHPADFFIVASYGKIIPQVILDHPQFGALNVHPSTLPFYRGPSPIESTLLAGEETLGITIMKLDADMDHGPLLVQSSIPLQKKDTAGTLEVSAGMIGGDLLVQILPHYLTGNLIPKEQDHALATFCKKITKEQGEILLTDSSILLLRKWQALTPWPGTFFFFTHHNKKIRVKISAIDIHKVSDEVIARDCIIKVIPEGKKEMSFEDFLRGYTVT